ncbi:MAG: PAS domain S-box protein [Deltaproteobacteria bacterium]|uniref:histidine kinase n=1 Tax=Candidatus Desulfacyla euxinica TaxID=2841693 RepID=A0A8J6T8B4_9DELT|nr:PAS domain S-box protein [Candidatus Desulfacyla euxinica]MBL7218001.1 PAS domain S-box protein [Desulfobacteraceae bacterium]
MNESPQAGENHINDKGLVEKQALKYAKDLALIYQEEKARRKDLEAAHEKMRAVVDSMTDGMLAVDNDFAIIEANRVASQLLETKPAGLEGTKLFEVMDLPELKERLFRLKETSGSKDSVELEMSSPSRQVLRIDVSTLGGNKGYVLVLHDITSEKRVENLKNEFLAILSHELRTPLNGILGFTELLSDELAGQLEDDQAEYLQMITESGNRMANTVEELLNFAQVQSQGPESLDEMVMIGNVIKDALYSLKDLSEKNGISLELEKETEGPVVVGSTTMLKDLIFNIIENAIVFGKQGGQVSVQIDDKGEECQISVSDDGPGIAADELENVFKSFYQVEEHVTRTHEGLGLGLALAKHIAELHGGSIRLESELAKRTTCFVKLPKAGGG